jgi:purine-cytosine permease-like protein
MDLRVTASLAAAVESQDYTTSVVPPRERRGPAMLGLLWLTMVTGFPSVLAGVDWFRQGLTLPQVFMCCLASIAILMLYTVPACYLGADSGQTFPLLSRKLFGKAGSSLVSLNAAWISVLWYGLTAYFLANGLQGIFHLPIDTMLLSALLAVVMSFNNLFGFAGVANFAGYLAAPVLIIWVLITFFKAAHECPSAVLSMAPHTSTWHALTTVSAFLVGYAAWGNEPDFWRFSKPKLVLTVIPLVVSLAIGTFIFPIAGWMLACISGITNYAAATAYMTNYAFGGVSILAALVLFVTYCAQNDANLYTAINGIANLKKIQRKKLACVLTGIAAVCAAVLSRSSHSFEDVASLSSTILPCPTVVMIAEWYLISRFTKIPPDFDTVAEFSTLPLVRWSAVTAVLTGSAVGLLTAGIIPGLERFHFGVCSLQAWLTTFIVYVTWRAVELSIGRSAIENQQPIPVPELSSSGD